MAKKDILAALHNSFNCPEILSSLDLSKALSFLSETNDSKKQKQWIVTYMKTRSFHEDLVSKVSKVKDCYCSTLGSLCRLIDVGKKLPEIYDEEFVKRKIVELSGKVTLEDKLPEEKKIVLAKTPEIVKAENLFYFIDLEIEKFIKYKKIPEVPPQLLTSNKPELDILKEWIEESWKNELKYLEAAKDGDEFYSEAYSNLSLKQKNALKKFYLSVLSLIESKEQPVVVPKETKSIKHRKVKEKKKESSKQKDSMVFSNFVYLKKFNTIESFSPSKILSSSEIYLLDIKYKKLIYFKAKEGETFSINSMSISNFDEEKSLNKKIPTKQFEIIVAAILKGPKNYSLKVFNETESTPVKAIGKCNENILLLKAY